MNYKSLFIAILFFTFSVNLIAQQADLYKKEVFINKSDTILYRILFPKNFSTVKQYPIVLFLHGAGERGNDNVKQLVHGSSLFTNKKNKKNFPAIVVFPQCPENDYCSRASIDRSEKPIKIEFLYNLAPTKSMALVMDLIENLASKRYVINNQIYVMGLSMGGMGTFEILHRMPETFAAAIPICGAGNPKFVKSYAKTIPIWLFHGAKDDVVNPVLSLNMASAILEAGGHPRVTIFENASHNSWDPAFAEPELLKWLFSKEKFE